MKLARVVLPVIVLMLAGCGNKNILSDPVFQAQLQNDPDDFAFQVSNLSGITQTVQWTWQNTNTNANINHSSSITEGTATLTITDASGVQMASEPLAPSGTNGIGSGTPGNWTIRLTLTNVTGTVNFEVQTAP